MDQRDPAHVEALQVKVAKAIIELLDYTETAGFMLEIGSAKGRTLWVGAGELETIAGMVVNKITETKTGGHG